MKKKQQKEEMSNLLPLDIISNILSRLPVKPLGQYKSVCTAWRSLISNPQFAKSQLHRATSLSDDWDLNRSWLLITCPFHLLNYESPSSFEDAEGDNDDDDAILDLDSPYEEGIPADDYVEIVGSCNGLVCFLHREDAHDLIIVWNPTIKVSRKLPPPPPSTFFNTTFLFGFGYDTSTDDYKVLRMPRLRSTEPTETRANIFSLNDGVWRIVQGPDNDSLTPHDYKGIFANGAIHWQAMSPEGKDVIVSFDLVGEKFGEIQMPCLENQNDNDAWFHTLGNLQGCLSLQLSRGEDYFDFEVWVMKEIDNVAAWTSLGVLSGGEVLLPHDEMRPVCFTKNGEIIIDLDSEQLVRFNIQDRTMKVLKTRNQEVFECAVYIQSLVSPYPHNNKYPSIDQS